MIRACYIGVLILFCGADFEAHAQDQGRLDSLKSMLEKKQGKDRAEVFWEIARYYADQELDNGTAAIYAKKAYEIAGEAPVDSLLLVKMGRRNAAILRRQEKYDEVFFILDYILPIARRNGFEDEVNLCESTAALIYGYKGDFDKALLYNLHCLRYREQVYDSLGMSISLHNIGVIYMGLNFNKRATYYSLRSLDLKRRLGEHYDEGVLLSNIGLCYRGMGNYKKAFDYMYSAKTLCKPNNLRNAAFRCYLVLGLIHADLHNYDSARYYALLSSGDAGQDDINYLLGEKFRLLAKIENGQGNYKMALMYLGKGESRLLRSHLKMMLCETYEEFTKAYKGLGDYERASFYNDKYLAYADSLLNEQMSLLVTDKQVAFEQEQNKAQLQLQESTVQWQGRQNFWIALIGGLLIIAIELLIYDYTGRKRENQILEAMVHDRTRTLQEKVRSLEREETERKTWEQKMDRAISEGSTRLEALTTMAGKQQLTDAVRILHTTDTRS